MDFPSALEELLDGQKVRRKEWKDKEVYLIINDEVIRIYNTKKKGLDDLIVSTGDIEGEDWEVLPKIPQEIKKGG